MIQLHLTLFKIVTTSKQQPYIMNSNVITLGCYVDLLLGKTIQVGTETDI